MKPGVTPASCWEPGTARTEERIGTLLASIEEAMGGNIELDKTVVSISRYPVKAGWRCRLSPRAWPSYAMLARLISTGSLLDKGYLFWDEPEANLNPKLIKKVYQQDRQSQNPGLPHHHHSSQPG